jgi:hypothetical protein
MWSMFAGDRGRSERVEGEPDDSLSLGALAPGELPLLRQDHVHDGQQAEDRTKPPGTDEAVHHDRADRRGQEREPDQGSSVRAQALESRPPELLVPVLCRSPCHPGPPSRVLMVA